MFVSLEDYNCYSKVQPFQKTLQSFHPLRTYFWWKKNKFGELYFPDKKDIPSDSFQMA